jgi:hypothetical protein
MNKSILFSFAFFLFFQISFCQDNAEGKYKKAIEYYKQDDFASANQIIKEIKPLYKTVPPKVLYLEIMAKSAIIKNNPLNDFSIISETRNLTSKYLKDNVTHKNENYAKVKNVSVELNAYPKDKASFLVIKQEKEKEELVRKQQIEQEEFIIKEQKEKAAAVALARKEQDAIEAKNRLKKEEIARKEKLEANKLAVIEAEKIRADNVKADVENRIKTAEQNRIYYKDMSFRKGFSSLGMQSGEIAQYGLLYESGGSKTIGFHISARTSLTSEEDILSGSEIENKTEIEFGPNFRLSKRLYLNIGAGYGYYDKVLRNDYAGTLTLEKTGYLAVTSGLMIRISRVVNINGGVSFMDIDKEFYKPEITFGISFNLKGKN